jgi:hypothetical protein
MHAVPRFNPATVLILVSGVGLQILVTDETVRGSFSLFAMPLGAPTSGLRFAFYNASL